MGKMTLPATPRSVEHRGRAFGIGFGSACIVFLIGLALHAESKSRIRSAAIQFAESAHVTESTPRLAMAIPFSEMRADEKHIEQLFVFPSALSLKRLAFIAAKKRVEADLAFMADNSNSDELRAESAQQWLEVERKLGTQDSEGRVR